MISGDFIGAYAGLSKSMIDAVDQAMEAQGEEQLQLLRKARYIGTLTTIFFACSRSTKLDAEMLTLTDTNLMGRLIGNSELPPS